MNFVYICRDGDNEELRYSIRSVIKHFPEANILLVGGKPNWYSGPFIKLSDQENKFESIVNCYKKICKLDSIDDFILMNDDFFILKRPESFEHLYDGTLAKKIQRHTNRYGLSKYSRILSHANTTLKKMGIESPLNYDIHTPMLFNKEMLSEILDLSLAPRSLYGNIFGVGGKNIEDVKVYKYSDNVDMNTIYLSTEDNSFKRVSERLSEMFDKKTNYELF